MSGKTLERPGPPPCSRRARRPPCRCPRRQQARPALAVGRGLRGPARTGAAQALVGGRYRSRCGHQHIGRRARRQRHGLRQPPDGNAASSANAHPPLSEPRKHAVSASDAPPRCPPRARRGYWTCARQGCRWRRSPPGLNAERVPTAHGGAWHPTTVSRILARLGRHDATGALVNATQLGLHPNGTGK